MFRKLCFYFFNTPMIPLNHTLQYPDYYNISAWASYQIRKFATCACARNARNVFPATDIKGNRLLAIPTCITVRASRTCLNARRHRRPAVTEKTFPAFPAHAQLTILRIWQEAHSYMWGRSSLYVESGRSWDFANADSTLSTLYLTNL